MNVPTTIQKEKLNILTVQEVLHQFNMKSPKQASIKLYERSSFSANKSLCSPKNQKITQLKLPNRSSSSTKISNFDLSKKNMVEDSKKEESAKKNMHNVNIQRLKQLQMINQNKSVAINFPEKGKSRIISAQKNMKKQDFKKRTITKLMKISQIDQKQKENRYNLPALNLKANVGQKKIAPLSQRQSNEVQPVLHKRSTTTKSVKNIKLDPKIPSHPKSCKNFDEQNYFRKGSSASTMSFKSKHTKSMQYFDDYEQLFPKQSTKISQKSEKSQKNDKSSSNNPFSALQEVRNKIYSQIDSLDKKLLVKQIRKQSKKSLKICLKKKNSIKVELPSNQAQTQQC